MRLPVPSALFLIVLALLSSPAALRADEKHEHEDELDGPQLGATAEEGRGMTDKQFDRFTEDLKKDVAKKGPHVVADGVRIVEKIHDKFHHKYLGSDRGNATGRVPVTGDDVGKFRPMFGKGVEIHERRWRVQNDVELKPKDRLVLLRKIKEMRENLEEERRGAQTVGWVGLNELIGFSEEARDEVLSEKTPRVRAPTQKASGYVPFFGDLFNPAVGRVREGYEEFSAGDSRAARARASEALELDPDNIDALRLRAFAAGQQGDYAAAAADAKHALEVDPDDKSMQSVYGLTAGRGEIRERAFASADAGSLLGQNASMLAGAGAAAQAGSAADAANGGLLRQARERMKLGDYGEAESYASKALALNPKDANALYLRAIARGSRGDYAGALSDAVAAAAADPADPKPHAAKAVILNKLGRYGEAERAALEALERDAREPSALRALAHARAGLGDRAGMLEALKRAAEANPQMEALYAQAVQAPEDADLLLLFADQLSGKGAQAARTPLGRSRRWGLAAAASAAVGGALLGWGLLRFLLPPLRSAFTRLKPRGGKSSVLGVSTPAAARPDEEFALLKGQFRIVRQIGAGGMGVVFLGEDVTLGRSVAIKRMREEIKVDRRERERFVSEAKLVAALRHPNIVEIYSIVEEGGDLLLVFEYVSGKTLHALVQAKGRLSIAETLPILRGVAQALEHAHEHAVIHRDLKPSNIMVDDEGRPRVMDFGIARTAKDALTRQAMTNTIVGTPPYMAPEQEQGLVRKESDVYALAICVYEMLTGRLAFAGTGAGMLMNKLNKSFAPITTLAPELPAAFDEIFAKAFDPDPNKRFRTAGELFAAVEGAAVRRA